MPVNSLYDIGYQLKYNITVFMICQLKYARKKPTTLRVFGDIAQNTTL